MNTRQEAVCDLYRYDCSPLWGLHRDYFLNRGLAAWSKGEIPYTGISNYVEAFKKALVIVENLFLISLKTEITEIRVLEVGAGYGEFAKNFFEAFDHICKEKKLDFSSKLNYYISDFSSKTLEELKQSQRLSQYQERIHFLQLDVLEPNLDNENFFDAIIANYLLDQLPARVFAHSKGVFYEKYISMKTSPEEFLKKNPRITINKYLKKIPKKIEFKPINLEQEIKKDHLEILEQCFRKNGDSTVVYSYGALKASSQLLKLLKRNGIFICSDFIATTKPGIDNYEPCYYGNSIAHPVNFEFILKYFSKGNIIADPRYDRFKITESGLGHQAALVYEDPLKPLHTLILTRPDYEQVLALGKIYQDVYRKNGLLRALYRFCVELRLSLILFLIILVGFLVWELFK